MRAARPVLALAALALASCASSEVPPHLTRPEQGTPGLDRGLDGLDGLPAPDRSHGLDAGADLRHDQGCLLGTVESCSKCGESCPPGKDPTSALRVCLSGKCDLQCQEEGYDVDGTPDDGCEVTDDLPIHDSATDALDLGAVTDCDSPVKRSGLLLPSDDRKHLKAPTDRPNGRADWFKLHIKDSFGCVVDADVKVSLTGLSAGAQYRAVAYWRCDGGTELGPESKTGPGGQTLSLSPSTSCTTLGDDSGTLYLKVSKDSGAHSAGAYSIEIGP